MDSQAEDRDGFRFRGGSIALDLAATRQGRLKPDPRELLATRQDLDRWLVSAGLVTSPPGATAADLAMAHALREVVFTLAGGLGKEALDPDARDVLNRIAAAPAAAAVLDADGHAGWQGSVAALLASLAREAVHLFGGEDAARVRQCQSPACTLFFIDTSRSGDRRWCSMSACGNKAKVAEFRRRKQEAAPRA
ncbi:MAG TPA: ABATE domain-containing protein [Sphingomonas sp.]|nr:ABATE domain-containing protein [Sphingomonas sp.]